MTLVSTPILRLIVFEARLALKSTVCNQINQSNPLWGTYYTGTLA